MSVECHVKGRKPDEKKCGMIRFGLQYGGISCGPGTRRSSIFRTFGYAGGNLNCCDDPDEPDDGVGVADAIELP